MGLQPLSRPVIDAVVQYNCEGAPAWNFSLRTMAIRLALSMYLAQHQQ